jgi:hypothetical protein
MNAPRLEDHVMIFHAQCGGIVTGELGKPLTCAECGKEMTAFVSADEETDFAALREERTDQRFGGQ